MRRAIAWLIDGLPFDPRSRRAIDETMLDWAHEEAESIPSRRWLSAFIGVLAVVRTISVASIRETISVPLWWLLKRTILFVVLPALMLSIPEVLPRIGTIGGWDAVGLLLLIAPQWVPTVAPLGLLLCLMWRSRHVRVPPLGSAITVFGMMLVFLTSILPPIDEMLEATWTGVIATTHGLGVNLKHLERQVLLLRSANDLTNFSVWFRMSGSAALAASSVILAEALFRRIALRKLNWIAAVPMAYLMYVGLVSSGILSVLSGPLAAGASVWAQAGLILLASTVIQRRTNREIAGTAE